MIVIINFCALIELQWSRSPGKNGSHFNPYSDLFSPGDRKDVILSTLCWSLMVFLLITLSFAIGPLQLLKLYGVPYMVGSLMIYMLVWTKTKDFLHFAIHSD